MDKKKISDKVKLGDNYSHVYFPARLRPRKTFRQPDIKWGRARTGGSDFLAPMVVTLSATICTLEPLINSRSTESLGHCERCLLSALLGTVCMEQLMVSIGLRRSKHRLIAACRGMQTQTADVRCSALRLSSFCLAFTSNPC